jgi:excisionase family DNA binding protein
MMPVAPVARMLGVHADTVRSWVRSGVLPGLVVGDVIRIAPDDLDKFVATHTTRAVSDHSKAVRVFSSPKPRKER